MSTLPAANHTAADVLADTVERWLPSAAFHNPYCAVQRHLPCDCDMTRAAPARAALAALRARAAAADQLADALRQIASCEKRVDGDVVDLARSALAAYDAATRTDA